MSLQYVTSKLHVSQLIMLDTPQKESVKACLVIWFAWVIFCLHAVCCCCASGLVIPSNSLQIFQVIQYKWLSLEYRQLLCVRVKISSHYCADLLPATLWHHISIPGVRFCSLILQTWCHSSFKLTSWQAVLQLQTQAACVCVLVCVNRKLTTSHPATRLANRKSSLCPPRWPASHCLSELSSSISQTSRPPVPNAGPRSPKCHALSKQKSRRARPVSTFVWVHHALQHGDRVVRPQLQGDVPDGLHQVGEEVGHLPAVLQENVAVLPVGEVRVAQVGPGKQESQEPHHSWKPEFQQVYERFYRSINGHNK